MTPLDAEKTSTKDGFESELYLSKVVVFYV